MSHAPKANSEDSATEELTAFLEANSRREELLRNGVSFSGLERNCCFLNTTTESFANISAASGLDHIGDGRAYALVDWDHDGDLDVWATNRTAPRVQLHRNNTVAEHNFISVRLQGISSRTNRDAIGARVELVLKGDQPGKLIKTVHAGEGFLSQSSKSLHFGMGTAQEIEQLVVRWPGAEAEVFTELQPNRHYRIVQGSGQATPWSRPSGESPLVAATGKQLGSSDQARIPLRFRVPLPRLPYETVDGENRTVRLGSGTPTLVNLWASWCQPCLQELVEFRKQEQRLRARGLELIALSVDQLAEDRSSNPAAARAFLKRQEFPFEAGFATNELIGKIEAAFYYLYDYRRPWAVPTSLLLDRKGQLAVVYVGPVDVDTLIDDIKRLKLNDSQWFEQALPFTGHWSGESRHPNLAKMIQTYLDRGFEEDGYRFVDKYSAALLGDPEAAPLLAKRAASLSEQGDATKALRRFEQAVAANPENVGVRFDYARLLAKQRQFEEAIPQFREVIRLQPENPDAHFFLANLLQSQGDLSGALRHFQETVKLRPQHAKARFALGSTFAAQLQWQQASEQFRQAVELEPENATYHVQLGRVLQKSGSSQDAIAEYQRALELAGDSGEVLYYLGAALAAEGDKPAAIRNLNKAHQLQPDSLLISNGLAWIIATYDQASTEDRAAALQVAESAATRTNHKHPQVLDTLAAAYAAVGKFDQAVQTAERAVQLASAANSEKLAQEIQKRLALYRNKQAYRE